MELTALVHSTTELLHVYHQTCRKSDWRRDPQLEGAWWLAWLACGWDSLLLSRSSHLPFTLLFSRVSLENREKSKLTVPNGKAIDVLIRDLEGVCECLLEDGETGPGYNCDFGLRAWVEMVLDLVLDPLCCCAGALVDCGGLGTRGFWTMG